MSIAHYYIYVENIENLSVYSQYILLNELLFGVIPIWAVENGCARVTFSIPATPLRSDCAKGRGVEEP
jgi:hypothetical protein